MYSHQTCSITPLQVIIVRVLWRHRDERGPVGKCQWINEQEELTCDHWRIVLRGIMHWRTFLWNHWGTPRVFNRCLCVRPGKRHSKPWECGPSESSVWEDGRRTRHIYGIQQMILILLLLLRHGSIWRRRFSCEVCLGREWRMYCLVPAVLQGLFSGTPFGKLSEQLLIFKVSSQNPLQFINLKAAAIFLEVRPVMIFSNFFARSYPWESRIRLNPVVSHNKNM